MSSANVGRYYAWLTRFQDVVRRLGHDTGQQTLTVHRLLVDPATGRRSGDVLHAHVLRALASGRSRTAEGGTASATWRVLDAGCGLGGTALYLHEHLGGEYIGITLSDSQCERARNEALARGVGTQCRFAVRSYDADLDDLVHGGVDAVVMVESLAHAVSPGATLARLASHVRPGGRLLIVDDVPDEALSSSDRDLLTFQRGWMCPALARRSELLAAARTSGLELVEDRDLTEFVPRRSPGSLAVRIGAARVASLLGAVTPARVLLDSIHGGLALERLYARRLATYRLLVFERASSRSVVA